MKLFVTIYNDTRLAPHFFRHYAKAGVTEFFVAATPRCESQIRRWMTGYRVTLVTGLPVYRNFFSSTAIMAMRERHQCKNEWIIIVDLDEFIEFPTDLQNLVAEAERDRANVVRGIMHDRFSADGRLCEFAPDADLAAVFPVKSRFIRDVMGGNDHKGVLVRGHLKPPPTADHHWFDGERLARRILEISHYKWIAGAVDRLRESHRAIAAAHVSWADEYKRALDHYDAHGRFAWEEFGGRLANKFQIEEPLRCAACGAPVWVGEFVYSVEHFGQSLCRADQALRRHGAGDGG